YGVALFAARRSKQDVIEKGPGDASAAKRLQLGQFRNDLTRSLPGAVTWHDDPTPTLEGLHQVAVELLPRRSVDGANREFLRNHSVQVNVRQVHARELSDLGSGGPVPCGL